MRRALLLVALAVPAAPLALPPGFVHADVAVPSLRVDARYAGSDNFLGRPVAGYVAPRVVLSRQVADALARIQERIAPFGLSLKVLDGYRPQRAVDDFVRWARDPSDAGNKAAYYPDLAKGEILAQGYVAMRSGHTRGSAVDVTLVSTGPGGEAELDMGGTFDWFGPRSAPDFPGLTPQQRANRLLLRTLMLDAGFKPLPQEWWHFSLRDEPYPATYFDFPVE